MAAILLIEDDVDLRRLVANALSREGHHVESAATALAALESVPQGSFDVIILDGSDPVGPSEGLFGRAFHEGCRRLLRPGGVFAAQTESPFLFPEVFRDTVRLLRDVHGRADPYFGPAPLYAAGAWSWTHAGGSGPRAGVGE